jgi:hypothetical protein
MQAMTPDVSEMAQELISACEGAMVIINCADTEDDEHDTATAAFDEAASSLGELGFVYEVTRDGVAFSRSEPDVEKYDPTFKIGASPFLGLNGTVEIGSLDRVIDVAEFKALNRCPVIVCPNVQVKGVKSTVYKFCANPSKFTCGGHHFCGVHKNTLKNHPGALEEGRIFVCKSDVVVCSGLYGMALAYSLNEAHVVDHCERVGAQPGMGMALPLTLVPSSKDKELRSIVPRQFPDFGLVPSATGEETRLIVMIPRAVVVSADTVPTSAISGGGETESRGGSETEEVPPPKGLRLAPTGAGGVGDSVDHGGGSAAARRAKKLSQDRRRPKRASGGGGGRDSSKDMFGQLLFAPLGDAIRLYTA